MCAWPSGHVLVWPGRWPAQDELRKCPGREHDVCWLASRRLVWEGTVIKREPYRYNVQALRKSIVAGLPVDTFHWLLDNSLGFNRYIMNQLNERLGQFIGAREIDRLSNPDLRVARSLAALFNPVLFPYAGSGSRLLRITQQELAYLVGLSRQRVNEALGTLEAAGAIQVEYGGLRVLDLEALRSGHFSSQKTQRSPSAEVGRSAMA